jgi:hypothetical protein
MILNPYFNRGKRLGTCISVYEEREKKNNRIYMCYI